jgi:hypothetical protein
MHFIIKDYSTKKQRSAPTQIFNHFQITKKFEKKEFNHAIISIVIRV